MDISADVLKELVFYDPVTGDFTLRKATRDKGVGESPEHISPIGYSVVTLPRSVVGTRHQEYSHRLAFLYMTGSFPVGIVDHLDGNKLNNSWDNIKDGNRQDNQKNMKKSAANTSGISGVFWDKSRSKWLVQVGKKFYGRFSVKEDAISKRDCVYKELGYSERHGK